MSEEDFKRAKEALLASGLPLEMSIERLLWSLPFITDVSADFAYWRRTEGGHKDFSVDVRGTAYVPTPHVTSAENFGGGLSVHATWDLLVECKYRKPRVKWLFAPRPEPAPGQKPSYLASRRHGGSHSLVNIRGHVSFGPEAGEVGLRTKDNEGNVTDLTGITFVTRGVECRPAGATGTKDEENVAEAFTTPIRRGVTQLQFAHVPRLTESLGALGLLRGANVLPGYAPREVHLHISTLILVTTAELWTFKRTVDLAEIAETTSFDDIAVPVSAVEYETVPSRELRQHQVEWLDAFETAKPFLNTEDNRRDVWQQVRNQLAGACPSVYIVNKAALEETLNKLRTALAMRIHDLAEEYSKTNQLFVRSPRPTA